MLAMPALLGGGFFWYFAALGLFLPFWPLFLAHRGFGATDIGVLMGVYAGLRIIGPPAFAHWADAPGRRVPALKLAGFLSLACVVAFHYLGSFITFALLLGAFSALWNGLMPIYDALVLDRVGADAGRYGLLRLWGSLGFIATALGAGLLLDGEGMARLPWLLAACVAMTCVLLMGLRSRGAPAGARRGPLWQSLRDRRVQALLLVSFLMLLSHGAYYGFFSLYLERYGYSRSVIGMLWSLGVAAEILVFLMAARLTRRYHLTTLLSASLAATVLRWAMLAAWPESALVVTIAQCLHLASFGLFHLCMVTLTRQLFPAEVSATAQALHTSVGYGAGGMLGAIASGYLWRDLGPQAPFVAATAIAALGWLVSRLGLGANTVPAEAGRKQAR